MTVLRWAGAAAVAFAAVALPIANASRAAECATTIFPLTGTYAAERKLHGPGLVLAGGGAEESPRSMLRWMHRRLGGTQSRFGNVVVVRASGARDYDAFFYRDGNFRSVQTVLVPPCASRTQVDRAVPVVERADAVFFAGGDQSHYVAWKGSALMQAVQRVYARGGIVGGGSAGLAIQGAVVYDAVAADRYGNDTHTLDAVRDPMERRISFTTGLFAWPALNDTITDTHLVVRDRFGRLVAFLARILHDRLLANAPPVYGLGIDQASVVTVDPDGTATVLNGPGGRGAYLIRASQFPQLRSGRPLHYSVMVSHLGTDGQRFDLLHKASPRPWYAVTVDGSRRPPYDRNPYRP